MADIGYDLDSVLRAEPDLEKVKRALIREMVVRDAMDKSGEDRQTVVDTLDAMASMDQESVLGLTEGEPTTLRDALDRYVGQLDMDIEARDAKGPVSISDDLTALLNYPWPGPCESPCAACEKDPDVTHLHVDVTWRPLEEGRNYYEPDERRMMLERWIESALVDRADSPTPQFGA